MAEREVGVLAPERREQLLAAAADEFTRAGYERASLNRIIRDQGMSKSSFYHYFASKEALFNAVVTGLATAVAEALNPPSAEDLTEGDFWPRITELTDHLARISRDEPAAARLAGLYYLADAPNGAGTPITAVRNAVDDWIDRALEIGRARGEVGDGLPIALQRHLAKAVIWAMDEWTVANLDRLSPTDLGRLPATQLDAIKRLLAADEERG
ncbi:TetR/AcrR family transcriptional regulator [Glycomyces buryatensis]|nr:TetR/AcrR family transcriptional regulator [Glycomyces buryatensis]